MRSATWLDVAATELWKAPISATTLLCAMRRSASAAPVSGDPWWSAAISSIGAPPSPGRPASAASGIFRSGYFLFTMSTARRMPFSVSSPDLATCPDNG